MLPPPIDRRDLLAAYGMAHSRTRAPPVMKTVRSIAFFGRIEARKGVVALCTALDIVSGAAETG